MENEDKHNKNYEETLASLESLDDVAQSEVSNVGIVDEASRYNVNLDSLEEIEADAGQISSIENNQETLSSQEVEYHKMFKDLDVRLNDVIEKIFRKSDRPFVIIQDDKIKYANKTFLKLVSAKSEDAVLNKNFLSFVAKEDWSLLAENIGQMLTIGKIINIKIKDLNNRVNKMKFEGIFLNDRQNFSFILSGERLIAKSSLVSSLYDPVTELPSFYLLEDRVQVAVDREHHKDFRLSRANIALVGINIDNMKEFSDAGKKNIILKKMASKLVLSLKKSYTVSAGLKYHFWVLMVDFENMDSFNMELSRLKKICSEPISDDYDDYDLKCSIGGSMFPDPAPGAKKLLEQAVMALDKAIRNKDGKTVMFGD